MQNSCRVSWSANIMKLAMVIFLAVGFAASSGRRANASRKAGARDVATFYVALNGDDSFSGTLPEPNAARTDGPFRTFARAQKAVREAKRNRSFHSIRVLIRGGVYDLDKTIVFRREDGGSKGCSVSYEAFRWERVVLRGGKVVRNWTPWKGKIFQADLKAQGLAGARFHQLFQNGQRLTLARFPNVDEEHPRTGGFLYVEERGLKPREQFQYAEGTIPFDQWKDLSQAEIVSVYFHGWTIAITPIESVDTRRRFINVRRVRLPFLRHNRFFIQNVLGALDVPNEWYHDRKTDVLYLGTSGHAPPGPVIVPVLDNIVEVRGKIPYPHGYLNVHYHGRREDFPVPKGEFAPVENLHFRGLVFECARRDAIRMVGAKNCSVIGCSVKNVGGVGINFGGVIPAYEEVGNPRVTPADGVFGGVGGAGQDLLFNDPCQACRAIGNNIESVGSDGIFLYGTGNIAENNHVCDIGLFDKDCACINLFGEKNVARRNTLHDVPRNAIFLKGVDNVVELNDIARTMLETCDGGAIRMCQRNVYLRGNVIRFNRIIGTVGYGYPRGSNAYQSPYFSWGVYLDDFTCGTTVYGNIIVRTGRGGVHVHGGSDNIVENNIIVNAGKYQYEMNPIRKTGVTGNRVCQNVFDYDGRDAYLYRCGRWLDGAVTWDRNVVWPHSGKVRVMLGFREVIDGWAAWRKRGFDLHSVKADPLFENRERGDYRLRENSPAAPLGFQEIPFDKIGCFASPDRASSRIDVRPRRFEVRPFLPTFPPRPLHEDFESELPGKPPRRGDVSISGKARILVTRRFAAKGQQSLMFIDAPNLSFAWQPRIYYRFDFRKGVLVFGADFRLDGKRRPIVTVDFRQYRDSGTKEFLSGPWFTINQEGELRSRLRKLADVPFDQWFHVSVTMPLGQEGAKGSLVLSVPNGSEQTFSLPPVDEDFKMLDRIVIMGPADADGVFYVDNLSCVCRPARKHGTGKIKER